MIGAPPGVTIAGTVQPYVVVQPSGLHVALPSVSDQAGLSDEDSRQRALRLWDRNQGERGIDRTGAPPAEGGNSDDAAPDEAACQYT